MILYLTLIKNEAVLEIKQLSNFINKMFKTQRLLKPSIVLTVENPIQVLILKHKNRKKSI